MQVCAIDHLRLIHCWPTSRIFVHLHLQYDSFIHDDYILSVDWGFDCLDTGVIVVLKVELAVTAPS